MSAIDNCIRGNQVLYITNTTFHWQIKSITYAALESMVFQFGTFFPNYILLSISDFSITKDKHTTKEKEKQTKVLF